MGRPKANLPKRDRARQLFHVKGWPEWGSWVSRLKDYAGEPSVASLVEAALREYARRAKFKEPAPQRWWMSKP
jgi:hypothetical protein